MDLCSDSLACLASCVLMHYRCHSQRLHRLKCISGSSPPLQLVPGSSYSAGMEDTEGHAVEDHCVECVAGELDVAMLSALLRGSVAIAI